MRSLTNLRGVLRSYAGATLFGESYGEGPVRVVWLHGWGRRGEDFAAVARVLADQGVASVALDLPGFGSSPSPAAAGGARHYAELIAPALGEIATEPLVLVGHSFGGTVALVAAARRPEGVAALVLTGAPVLRRPSAARSPRMFRLQRWLASRGLLSQARLEAARQRYGSADYRRASGVMRDVLVATVNESYEDELAAVTAPVFLLWGEGDTEARVEVATRAEELLAAPHELRVLPGVGHFVPLEAPDALVAVVREALDA